MFLRFWCSWYTISDNSIYVSLWKKLINSVHSKNKESDKSTLTHPMRFLNKEMDSLSNYDSSGMSYVKKYTILAKMTFFDITLKNMKPLN
jgi:hypothetical protein